MDLAYGAASEDAKPLQTCAKQQHAAAEHTQVEYTYCPYLQGRGQSTKQKNLYHKRKSARGPEMPCKSKHLVPCQLASQTSSILLRFRLS